MGGFQVQIQCYLQHPGTLTLEGIERHYIILIRKIKISWMNEITQGHTACHAGDASRAQDVPQLNGLFPRSCCLQVQSVCQCSALYSGLKMCRFSNTLSSLPVLSILITVLWSCSHLLTLLNFVASQRRPVSDVPLPNERSPGRFLFSLDDLLLLRPSKTD